jgi:hypothetical protein
MDNPMCVKMMHPLTYLVKDLLDKSLRVLSLLVNLDRPLIHVCALYELHGHLDFILVNDKIAEVHHIPMWILTQKLTDVTLFQLYFCNHPIFVVNNDLFDSYNLIIVGCILALINFTERSFTNRHSLQIVPSVKIHSLYLIACCFNYFVDLFDHI